MPKTLGTNLNLCFTKLKRPLPPQSSNHNEHQQQQQHHSMHFCNSIKNFNSLYDLSLDYNSNPTSSSTYSTTIPDESDYIYELATIPDLATVYASQRFFFSSPGHSNSIIDSSSSSMSSSLASTSSSVEPPEPDIVVDGSIAIPTYSPDPYLDFRRSMQEMVEARGLSDISGNWDSLHELLMCYLTLNPKSTHKYIVAAFADLIVCLMSPKSQHLDPSAGCTSKCKQKCILDYKNISK
ncbi:transcription repressor OFP12-like [Lycium ferocissimum]|uniref:transcription repressor OFP12-like n=1 Tax=Lycium ferocissimum TaxID=112874 RepID=UPI0028151FEE|nr:transcription repressor OFP12-like [Lycium ferocissimum]